MLEPPVTPIRKANDGLELPATGFGTYKVNGLAGVDAIKSAIHQGYRLIDSAFNYENEGVVAVCHCCHDFGLLATKRLVAESVV